MATREQALESALRDLLAEVESLNGYELTRDVEPYKAEANWDDAVRRAGEALALPPSLAPLNELLLAVLEFYPEFEDDTDVTGCPTGFVTCRVCEGGGHVDGRKKMPPTHKPDCAAAKLRAALSAPPSPQVPTSYGSAAVTPSPLSAILRKDVRALVDAVVEMHAKHTGEMMNWPEWDAMSLAMHALPESHVESVATDGTANK